MPPRHHSALQVGEQLATCIQQGVQELTSGVGGWEELASTEGGKATNTASADSGMLSLMQDPLQARRREELRRIVNSLEKAWATLRNINA